MNFWSRTSSKTFNRYSEFHASKEAIIRRLTTFTALVLPLSTLTADEVFIKSTYSYIYIYIYSLFGTKDFENPILLSSIARQVQMTK